MTFTDKNLVCADCGLKFILPATEQQRRTMAGYANEPRRCPECRAERRRTAESRRTPLPRSRRGIGPIGTRNLFPAVCAACGRDTRLPFKPRGDRPAYCAECFGRRR